MRWDRRISGSRVVLAGAVAWFALWACAPPSVVAPMVPLNQAKGWDLGFAASAGAGPPVNHRAVSLAAGTQAWAVRDLGRVDIGGTLGAMGAQGDVGPHLGVMLRPHVIERENVVVGLDLQLGVSWASVGLPVSVRASDRVWVYTDPTLGMRYTGAFVIPVGLSVEANEHLRVSTEVELLGGDIGYIEKPFILGTVGLSYRP